MGNMIQSVLLSTLLVTRTSACCGYTRPCCIWKGFAEGLWEQMVTTDSSSSLSSKSYDGCGCEGITSKTECNARKDCSWCGWICSASLVQFPPHMNCFPNIH